MFDYKASLNSQKLPLLRNSSERDTVSSAVDLETIKLREKVAQLEKEMIDVLVEIENKGLYY